MKEHGVEKRSRGSSWIEVENKTHQFSACEIIQHQEKFTLSGCVRCARVAVAEGQYLDAIHRVGQSCSPSTKVTR